jgi:hypothetical protein
MLVSSECPRFDESETKKAPRQNAEVLKTKK